MDIFGRMICDKALKQDNSVPESWLKEELQTVVSVDTHTHTQPDTAHQGRFQAEPDSLTLATPVS